MSLSKLDVSAHSDPFWENDVTARMDLVTSFSFGGGSLFAVIGASLSRLENRGKFSIWLIYSIFNG